MNAYEIYIVGYLTVQTLLVLWFYSPLRITLGQVFFDKDLYTIDQFETRLLLKSTILGKLLSCYICTSFWVSLGTGVAFILFCSAPVLWPVITALTYPAICYLYKRVTD